jgi:vacuolar-type H+-ATPase subunit B/Vma2
MVFAAMGVKYDVAASSSTASSNRGAGECRAFPSLATILPSNGRSRRYGAYPGEHLAFTKGKQCWDMTDMTTTCESLREISTLRARFPAGRGIRVFVLEPRGLYERSGKSREGRVRSRSCDPHDAERRHRAPDSRPDGYITRDRSSSTARCTAVA